MKTLALLVALLLAVPAFGASIPGTIVAAKVTTGNDANTFSIGDSNEMNGTPKSVGTIAQRDAITMERRAVGMTCWVMDSGAEFQLVGGIQNSNWVERMTATYNYTTNFYFTYLTNLYIDNTVSNFYMTNLVYNTTVSNYFTTNVAYYSYTTNEYITNIINNDTYVSNFFYTNITTFPIYVSNYITTNYYTTITNIITNITTINFTTNVFVTNLWANFITNYYLYSSNAYITNLNVKNLTVESNLYILGGFFNTNYGTLATATNTAPTASGTNQWLMTLASDGAVTNTTGPGWVTYTLSSGTTNRYYWIGNASWRPIGNATSNDAPAGVLFIPSNKVAKIDIENLAGATNYSCAVQRP